MLTILAPAKRMETAPVPGVAVTRPRFLAEAGRLAAILKGYGPGPLEAVLRTNPALAMKAYMDYQDMDLTRPGAPALFAYRGLVFSSLDPATLTAEQIAFAQEHLRILSGFYGLLRPLDGILPHRLEMGHRLPEAGGSLYGFWGDKLYRALYEGDDTVVNLASVEYARAVTDFCICRNKMVTCEFYVLSRGRYKVLATAAKMARGAMARFILTHGVDRPEGLMDFDEQGYRFAPGRSTDRVYRFYQQ